MLTRTRTKRVSVMRQPTRQTIVRANNGVTTMVIRAPRQPVRPSGQGVSRQARRRRTGRSAPALRGRVVSAPSSNGMTWSGGSPNYSQGSKPGVLSVSHHEEITSLLGTTAFTSQAYAGAPGNFPWLSGLAQNFSRFRWLNFSVRFSTTSSTSDRGDVSLGVTYDIIDSLPESMAEASCLANSVTAPIWSPGNSPDCNLRIDCSRATNAFYPFITPAEGIGMSGQDFIDYVPFWILASKQTSVNGQLIGRVYCSYTIELSDPIPARMNTTPVTSPSLGMVRSLGEVNPPLDPSPSDDLRSLVEALRLLSTKGKEIEVEQEPSESGHASEHSDSGHDAHT
jgi:hypothetical protein